MQGRIFNFGGRKDGRIDIFIEVIRAVNCIRIYYGLLRIDYYPWSVASFVQGRHIKSIKDRAQ